MKHLMTLLGLAVSIAVGAQTDCGLQYDGNGDGAVDALDLLGLLSEYSDTCEPVFACGDSVLFDGYSYETVPIGDQCWFKENLRTEHYANGDAIPGDLSIADWAATESGAQAILLEDLDHLAIYGRLYNG